ncbi:hypothetical protein BH20ACT4_BH20ACT4_09740 [soil metagenome]
MSTVSRRALLRAGSALSLGAIVAACGDRQVSRAPGRVGNVPPVTDLPQGEVDDVALLRTAMSLEFTAIEVYRIVTQADLVDDVYVTPFERFVSDHQEHAELLSSLTTKAGGKPYTCPNPWIMNRAVAPIVAHIVGDEAAGIEPSDNPQRDVVNVALAFENLAGASYQALVGQLAEPDLRRDLMLIAVDEVRHASVIAMIRTGTPKAYVGPELAATGAGTGTEAGAGAEEAEADEDGLSRPFVLQSRFGSLGALTLMLGKADEAGGRFSATLETPAANSIIYESMSC